MQGRSLSLGWELERGEDGVGGRHVGLERSLPLSGRLLLFPLLLLLLLLLLLYLLLLLSPLLLGWRPPLPTLLGPP